MQQANPIGTGPSTSRDRIEAIDVLRGVALLGILLINIRSFTMIEAVYYNPEAAGPLSGADHAVWWLGQLLAELKFMTLFSLLFGAGVVLMYERRDAAGLASAELHYRRMAGLFLIGLVHAYVLWYGDILVTYALCGLWLYLFRRRGPVLLITLGLVLLAIGSLINAFFGWSYPHWGEEAQAQFLSTLTPSEETIARETEVYRGGWLEQMGQRAETSIYIQTFVYAIWGLWRAGGVMLLGMGLMKLGVLTGRLSRGVYVAMAVVGCGIGLSLIAWGLIAYPVESRGTAESFFLGTQYNYWGSVPLVLGYVGLVMLMCRGGAGRWLSPLAAVGRTALTNYIGQTVICTMLFYGTLHSMGWFGRVGWTTQIVVVIAVWVLQLGVSSWWLGRFHMGPLEAVWRWGSYGQWPKMRKT